MEFQVYRANASSYQDSKFLANEKKIIEGIEGASYIRSLQEYRPKFPLIIISNTHTNPDFIPESILEKTALIIHPNSGYDNLSPDFIKNSHFPIVVGNPIRSNAVAEYTLSCLFHFFTQIPQHFHWHEQRRWERQLIRDQKFLILGHGNIGKILAKSLTPLVNNLTVFDPAMGKQDLPYRIENCWHDDLLDQVSVLLVAASLNETSFEMISSKNIGKLSHQSLIINPARGEIINEDALFYFLQKNPNSYAYLDVFSQEPFTPGFGSQLKNLNKTSHIAGAYGKLNADIISFEYLVIKDFIKLYKENSVDKFNREYSECILNQQTSAQ